jgi:GDP-D-mannose dehydratase
MPGCGSGVLVCSSSLLIRGPNLARRQAETPLIALFRFPEPAQGIVLEWQGAGREERGLCRTTGRVIVQVDDTFYRPSEVEFLLGDPRKAAAELDWRPKIVLETIIAEMVEADISRAKSRLILL